MDHRNLSLNQNLFFSPLVFQRFQYLDESVFYSPALDSATLSLHELSGSFETKYWLLVTSLCYR